MPKRQFKIKSVQKFNSIRLDSGGGRWFYARMIGHLAMVPGCFAMAWLIAWGTIRLATREWRRAASAHWTERARLLWPARRGASSNVYLLPVCFAALQFAFEQQFTLWCVAAGLAAWLGVLAATYSFDRQIYPSLTFRQWLHLAIMAWAMRLLFLLVWGGGAYLMPVEINGWTFVIAGGVLAFQLALGWRFWRMVLARTGIRVPANDRLKTIVVAASARMNIRPPGVWLQNVPLANAMALPLTRELLFTAGLMEVCTDEEVASVCMHELAHLKEPKSVLTLRVMGSLSLFPLLFLKPALCAYGELGFGLVPLCWVLSWLRSKVGRRMEKRADKAAVEQQNAKGVYAAALEKLYRANQIPAVAASHRRVHPHLYDRLLAAGIQPDFERPKPPKDTAGVYIAIWAAFGALIVGRMVLSGF